MKRLAFVAALLAAVALCSPAQAFNGFRGRNRVVVRQQVVVQRQRVAFVQPVVVAQPFVTQQFVAPVVQQVVVPGSCNSFFVH